MLKYLNRLSIIFYFFNEVDVSECTCLYTFCCPCSHSCHGCGILLLYLTYQWQASRWKLVRSSRSLWISCKTSSCLSSCLSTCYSNLSTCSSCYGSHGISCSSCYVSSGNRFIFTLIPRRHQFPMYQIHPLLLLLKIKKNTITNRMRNKEIKQLNHSNNNNIQWTLFHKQDKDQLCFLNNLSILECVCFLFSIHSLEIEYPVMPVQPFYPPENSPSQKQKDGWISWINNEI